MKVIFQNSQGNERVIAKVNTKKQAFDEIHKFLDGLNFTSYYIREYVENGRTKLDVGSYVQFFYLEEENE